MNERGLAKKVAGNPKLTQSPGTDEILNFGNFQIVVQLCNLGPHQPVNTLYNNQKMDKLQDFASPCHSPTVKEVQEVDCLQMAMQSRVTADSGWARRPLEEQPSPSPSHMTVVPEVFS